MSLNHNYDNVTFTWKNLLPSGGKIDHSPCRLPDGIPLPGRQKRNPKNKTNSMKQSITEKFAADAIAAPAAVTGGGGKCGGKSGGSKNKKSKGGKSGGKSGGSGKSGSSRSGGSKSGGGGCAPKCW